MCDSHGDARMSELNQVKAGPECISTKKQPEEQWQRDEDAAAATAAAFAAGEFDTFVPTTTRSPNKWQKRSAAYPNSASLEGVNTVSHKSVNAAKAAATAENMDAYDDKPAEGAWLEIPQVGDSLGTLLRKLRRVKDVVESGQSVAVAAVQPEEARSARKAAVTLTPQWKSTKQELEWCLSAARRLPMPRIDWVREQPQARYESTKTMHRLGRIASALSLVYQHDVSLEDAARFRARHGGSLVIINTIANICDKLRRLETTANKTAAPKRVRNVVPAPQPTRATRQAELASISKILGLLDSGMVQALAEVQEAVRALETVARPIVARQHELAALDNGEDAGEDEGEDEGEADGAEAGAEPDGGVPLAWRGKS